MEFFGFRLRTLLFAAALAIIASLASEQVKASNRYRDILRSEPPIVVEVNPRFTTFDDDAPQAMQVRMTSLWFFSVRVCEDEYSLPGAVRKSIGDCLGDLFRAQNIDLLGLIAAITPSQSACLARLAEPTARWCFTE